MKATTDLRDALDLVLADFRTDIHTSFPAKVLAYDPVAQTVDVRPALTREGTTEDGGVAYDKLPDLYSVQIMWPRAGGFAITFPIYPGDWVKITCAEQSTMVWRRNGVVPSNPGITDPHGLNGCVAEVGWAPDKAKLTDVHTSNLELRTLEGSIAVSISDSLVTLGSVTGAQFLALSNLVQSAVNAAIVGHTHASLGGPGAFIAPLTGCPSVSASHVKGS